MDEQKKDQLSKIHINTGAKNKFLHLCFAK